MHHETRACFSAEVLRSAEYRSDNRLRFGASFMPPGRSMFSAKMTAPVGVSTQPTHQPICGSTRLPSGLCPQDPIAPGLDDHDILDQTLMLDLERKLVSIQFSRGNPPVPWLKSGGRRRARSDPDTSGRVGVAILNPSQILLFAHTSTDLTGKLLITHTVECLMDERRVDPDSNRQSPVSRHPTESAELVTDRSGIGANRA